jgi:hypothetical protein
VEDSIDFVFDGKLADQNRMDFYEAARFQYAAARLSVKLDQFRRRRRFSSKVTRRSNDAGIELQSFRSGSFGIETIAPIVAIAAPMLIEVPLSAMWSYVIERIFKPKDEDNIREILETQQQVVGAFDRALERSDNTTLAALDALRDANNRTGALNEENALLYERLIAESNRRNYLEGHADALRQISSEEDAKLVTMAAPLLKELAVPLRRSADRANLLVGSRSSRRSILYADKRMADDLELSVVDDEITPLSINIIQYNKETGWGKFRSPDFDGLQSFAVPADRKDMLQSELIDGMDRDETYIRCYFVRSISGIVQRIIVVDILSLEEFEAGDS